MDIAQLFLLYQLQQMNTSWQKTQNGNGSSEVDGKNDTDSQLFAALLLAALGGGSGAAVGFGGQLNMTPYVGREQVNTNTNANAPLKYESGSSSYLQSAIQAAAQKYGLDPNLVQQVVKAESSFNPNVTSSAGAMGLMQLMPGTAAAYGVKDAYDVYQNLDGGAHYLKDMLNRYNGNVQLSLAAYNAGPGAVDKYNGIPPYKETQNYVQKIMSGLNQYSWDV